MTLNPNNHTQAIQAILECLDNISTAITKWDCLCDIFSVCRSHNLILWLYFNKLTLRIGRHQKQTSPFLLHWAELVSPVHLHCYRMESSFWPRDVSVGLLFHYNQRIIAMLIVYFQSQFFLINHKFNQVNKKSFKRQIILKSHVSTWIHC